MARLDEISHALGRQEGMLEAIERKLDEATSERGEVRQGIIDVKAELEALSARVTSVEATAAASKAVTDWVDKTREQGKGALFTAGVAGSAATLALGTIAAYWWDQIVSLFTRGP